MAKVLLRPRRGHPYSPLRYPGGKGPLAGFFATLMARKSLTRYVEPYAGGAGAAMDLLISGAAETVVINDLDPAVHSFWHSLLHTPDKLISKIDSTPLTIDEWRHQRAVYKKCDASNVLDLGFAAFYLNRTNRSGVMNAGVIGGQAQLGKDKIDARYDRVGLSKRVELIAAYADHIELHNCDGLELIRSFLGQSGTFIYADPPYYEKGSSLYLNSFDQAQHRALASLLNGASDSNWILTYDNCREIRLLYSERERIEYQLHYSAYRRETATELMILSDSFRGTVTASESLR